MRYRLVPARGMGEVEHLETDSLEWLGFYADGMHKRLDMPVVVCEAPEGGLVKRLYTVGGQQKGRRR